ncbi:MAG: TonB-dependent receptor [Bacteroidetes bacterium]|nr:TonB-dependent receptor [Bacteroidota bacterium]
MKKAYHILLFALLSVSLNSFAQENDTIPKGKLYQNIRGRVVDHSAGFPLPGVTVQLSSNDKIEYRITDDNGYFVFANMLVGYYNIRFSMVGYEVFTLERMHLISGKELVINQNLKEAVYNLEEVTIQSFAQKDKPINMRAIVSSRSFSLEETTKYAGSYGDPARMAANYAGVMPVRDNRNDIIIRGNSPSGLIWKVDGMEIPNPNHFGATGSTGGPITIVNTNLLGNSDFLTSNYPAEFSNSIAGVFDLKLRNGNAYSYEHWAQLGWNGLEFGTEGPLPHLNNASYIMSYRYSVVDLLTRFNIRIPEAAFYHDFSFKLNFPTKSAGTFSLVGLRGDSKIELIDSRKKHENWIFSSYSEDIVNVYRMGVIGVNHNISHGAKSLFTTTFYISGSQLYNAVDTFNITYVDPFPYAREMSDQMKYSLRTQFKHKFSSKTDFSVGLYADNYFLNFVDSQFVYNRYVHNVMAKNETLRLYRVYSDLLHRITPKITTYVGLNAQMLEHTGEVVAEPRINVSYNVLPRHTFSIGSGLYSQMQQLMAYYVLSDNNGSLYTNKDLKFTRSWHNVFGYDYIITSDLRVKLEAYYQYLFNVPVSVTDSVYSIINYGAEYYIERKDNLQNIGTGENYGVELTFEKFWSKNYFALLSGSLFESKYTGADGIKRNTAFNGNYAFNLLVGYEFIAPKRNRSANIGINMTYAGGMPYVPYDIEASVENRKVIYDWANAYTVKREDYKRISLRIGMRRNEKKYSIETAFDLQYRTNYTNVYIDRLDLITGEIIQTYKMGFYPMATIKVSF